MAELGNLHEAKTNFSKLLKRVQRGDETVIGMQKALTQMNLQSITC